MPPPSSPCEGRTPPPLASPAGRRPVRSPAARLGRPVCGRSRDRSGHEPPPTRPGRPWHSTPRAGLPIVSAPEQVSAEAKAGEAGEPKGSPGLRGPRGIPHQVQAKLQQILGADQLAALASHRLVAPPDPGGDIADPLPIPQRSRKTGHDEQGLQPLSLGGGAIVLRQIVHAGTDHLAADPIRGRATGHRPTGMVQPNQSAAIAVLPSLMGQGAVPRPPAATLRQVAGLLGTLPDGRIRGRPPGVSAGYEVWDDAGQRLVTIPP
jgi:hypothetical protein